MKKDIKDYLHLYLGCEVMLWTNSNNPAFKPQKKYLVLKEIRYDDIALNIAIDAKAKPILRPLSDMTEEEKIMLCCMNLTTPWQPGHIIQTNDDDIAAMRIFDMRGEYKSLYIPNKRIEPKNFLWLLSHHFDLFGLIEAGLAIDKTKIKTNG